MHIVTVNLWSKEKAGKYCPHHSYPIVSDLNQSECQYNCEYESFEECVGISYGYDTGNSYACYICNNDKLSDDFPGMSFYRRPGIFEVTFP